MQSLNMLLYGKDFLSVSDMIKTLHSQLVLWIVAQHSGPSTILKASDFQHSYFSNCHRYSFKPVLVLQLHSAMPRKGKGADSTERNKPTEAEASLHNAKEEVIASKAVKRPRDAETASEDDSKPTNIVAASHAGHRMKNRVAGSRVCKKENDKATPPKALQKLSDKILHGVIDHIRGSGTLKAWCAATNGSKDLYHHGLRRCHRRFVVSRKNILCRNPRITRRLPGRSKHDDKELLRMTRKAKTGKRDILSVSSNLSTISTKYYSSAAPHRMPYSGKDWRILSSCFMKRRLDAFAMGEMASEVPSLKRQTVILLDQVPAATARIFLK